MQTQNQESLDKSLLFIDGYVTSFGWLAPIINASKDMGWKELAFGPLLASFRSCHDVSSDTVLFFLPKYFAFGD